MPHSKKARIALALFVIFCAGLFVMFFVKGEKREPILNSKFVQSEEQIKKLNRDSDGDGLRDWEEVVHRTDPNAPDTDKDGTLDGEEIKQGRDPLKPGPDDLPTPITATTTAYASENLTELLSQKLGVNFILPRLQDSSYPLDPVSISEYLVSDTVPSLPRKISYFSEKDIKTTPDTSEKAFDTYGVAMADAARVFDFIKRSPLEILADALQKDRLELLRELDSYIPAYDAMLERLKKIETPPSLVSYHIQYMDLTLAQREAVKKIRNADKDIISALLGAKEFSLNFAEFNTLLKKISDAFVQ